MSPRPRAFEDNRGKRSRQHERRIAKEMGGQRLPRSGGVFKSNWTNKTTAKGDIRTSDLLIEHKMTSKDSIKVKREWLTKVKDGAWMMDKDPAVVLTFEDRLGIEEWVLVPRDLFDRLRKP